VARSLAAPLQKTGDAPDNPSYRRLGSRDSPRPAVSYDAALMALGRAYLWFAYTRAGHRRGRASPKGIEVVLGINAERDFFFAMATSFARPHVAF